MSRTTLTRRGRRTVTRVAAGFAALILTAPTLVGSDRSASAGTAWSAWDDVAVGFNAGPTIGELALDHGRPRFVFQTFSGGLGYAWCERTCERTSSWSLVALRSGDFQHAELVVDRWGRPRIASIDLEADAVVYSACDADCGTPSSWLHTTVDTTTQWGGLSFAVDPWGRPRLSYVRSPGAAHVFAACDADCTASGSWLTVDLGFGGDYPSLALDGAKPRMAYARSVSPRGFDLRYASCESDCLNKRAWTVTKVTWLDAIGAPSLVVENGRAHVAFAPNSAVGVRALAYTRCDGGCTDARNWSDPLFVAPGEDVGSSPILAVTQGRPRVFYGVCVNCPSQVEESHAYYAACDSGCTESTDNWSAQRLAPARRHVARIGFALDGERPRVAYRDYERGGETHYASCDACGGAGSWPAPPSSPPPASWPPPGSGGSGVPGGGEGGSSGGESGGGEGGSSGGAGGVGSGFVATGGSVGSGGGSGSTSSTARESEDVSAGGAGSTLVDGSGRTVGSAAGAGDGGSGVSVRRVDGDPGGLGEQVSRLPGAAIDVIRNPSQALSWPWGRIFLKGLAIGLLGLVGWMTYVASFDRFHRRTAG